jgi:two-component system CheB/CheR fusion protein
MRRILIVEDHADTAECCARLLRAEGYEVETAHSVQEARVAAAAQPVDLLLCDLGLPDGDARSLLQELRAGHGLSAIAVSGYGSPQALEASAEAGFAAHLVKPLDFDTLKSEISRVLDIER